MNIREFSYMTEASLGTRELVDACELSGLPWRHEGYGLLHCFDERYPSLYDGAENESARVTLAFEDVEYVRLLMSGVNRLEHDDDGNLRPAAHLPEVMQGFEVPKDKVSYVLLGWPDDWRDLRGMGVVPLRGEPGGERE